jgi:3-hydroxymyristoyl/3-hydroxydecanoyl-(acyl carrier protein) dehydratase
MILDPQALAEHIPHRGANLMPDVVVVADDGKHSTSTTRIPQGDPRGREIFGRRDAAGTACWYEPFLLELMALTGIPLLTPRLKPAGQVAVFSAISRVTVHRLAPLAAEVRIEAELTRDRGTFSVFSCKGFVEGQPLLECEVMSGVSTLAEVCSKPAQPAPLPAGTAVSGLDWKPAATRFADVVVARGSDGSARTAYIYPPNHPFVPGHFPGAPLMMGVTQLAAAADAAWIALGGAGTANVRVLRANGAEIAEIKDLALVVEGGLPRIASFKRIAFREPVRPGDALVIEANRA